jgi:tetratricopeptide (TPR) repeat protein
MSTERLQKLQEMLQKQPDDPFLLYGIAMEYKKAGQTAEALAKFDRVLAVDPGYCYAYYQKGLVLEETGDINAARKTYQQGIDIAGQKGDAHARSELQAALDLLG